jgi:hypothetical protein
MRRIIEPKLYSRLWIATNSRRPTTDTQKVMLELLEKTARAMLSAK